MRVSELIDQRLGSLRTELRAQHKSLDTERTYCGWIRRFIAFSAYLGTPCRAPEELARLFVEKHAAEWAVATQDQFRNALVFYYKHVLNKPLGALGEWSHARRPKRLPVWLPHAQLLDLLGHLRGPARLMAEVGYGSGLRSQELSRLRVSQINFTDLTITIRGGKGDKDRVTILPEALVEPLQRHLAEMRELWMMDRRHRRPGVEVPSRKFNGEDWPWFWVWAAAHESRDPRSGLMRRHHVHKSTLGKAISVAVKRWGGNQRVTQHSLRHSFATTLLENGVPIHKVKELLGHTSIQTTEIYAHLLPRFQASVVSPMDCAPANVVPLGRMERGAFSSDDPVTTKLPRVYVLRGATA